MKKTTVTPTGVPTAFLAVNKSRMKMYNKDEAVPTYYLQKGQEFMIELFNPTKTNILAKIYLNGKAISQGGLILKPGQRYFLERYIDVPNKFLFDTYEVSNTEEVRKAIEDNGDFKIEFYRESVPEPIFNRYRPTFININDFNLPRTKRLYSRGTGLYGTGSYGDGQNTFTTNSLNLTSLNDSYTSSTNIDSSFTSIDSAPDSFLRSTNALYSSNLSDSEIKLDGFLNLEKSDTLKKSRGRSFSKSIETGRVEKGSESSQQFNVVDMKFEYFAFHTIKYKMLPISQKINEEDDLKVKIYCTNCGSKLKQEFKFCPKCGSKS